MENKHGVSLLYVQVNSLPYPAQAGLLNKAEFFSANVWPAPSPVSERIVR